MTHQCREDDDLGELCMEALHFAQRTRDYLHLHNWERCAYRLHWSHRPTFHICTDHGIRKTCLIARFFVSRIPEDPHQ